jgi:beta-glucosidase
VEAGLGSIMASYNRVNGLHSCESEALNATVKKLWGFDGFIISDWAAYFGTTTAADNGLDLDMYNGAFGSTPLGNAIADGNVPDIELTNMVQHILTAMFLAGDFDNPTKGKMSVVMTNSVHQQFARDCAAAGTVLLQNNGLLPLNTSTLQSIAVIGSAAYSAPISTAYGSSEVVLPYNITPLAGITNRAAGSGIAVNYSQGDGGNIAAAVSLAQTSSIAIICVGQRTGEGTDRTSLSLPNDDDALIRAVSAVNSNTIVVMYCSSATLMPWSTNIAASLVAWFSGQENGNALAEVLFGDVNPSGHLPVTFPVLSNQVPASTPAQFPGINGHASYSEGLDIGYRWYDANQVTPLFPFGHGLSYTTFGYSNLTVSAVSPSGQVQISFNLSNTGTRTGAAVPQLYLGFPAAAGEPPKLLKGFTKVTLTPGQTVPVTFNLDWQDLADWDPTARGWVVTPGTFQVLVGASAGDLRLTNSFTVGSVPSSDLANAALHQVVTASSGTNFTSTILTPSYGTNFSAVVDGDPTTGWNSAVSDPQWLMVDLGMMKDLSRVRLQWNTNYASAYALQLSTNATTWTTLFSTNGDLGGVEDILVTGRGRYVRMLGTTQGVAGTGYGLLELGVYAQPQTPYPGSVPVLPAQIEAENFDNGGEGVGYYNTTAGNPGGAYRTNEDVGIEPCTDTGGGYDVGYVNPGEWLEYTVNAPDPEAVYSISVRVASGSGGGQLRLRLDGTLLGTVTVTNTGGWQDWQTITLPNVPVAGATGSRALRVEVINGGFNLNWIQFNRVQLCGTNNIALGQRAYASSARASTNAPSAAFDGNPCSWWWSRSGDPQWLTVDLGSIQNVARIRLDWGSTDWINHSYGHSAYSQSYSLQFSTDGKIWTEVYANTNAIGSVNDLAVSGRARYVRMNSIREANTNGVALFEFEVYPGLRPVDNQDSH